VLLTGQHAARRSDTSASGQGGHGACRRRRAAAGFRLVMMLRWAPETEETMRAIALAIVLHAFIVIPSAEFKAASDIVQGSAALFFVFVFFSFIICVITGK
jgi:hypothetical protein